MYKGKKIGVVVPAYNEEGFIASVIDTMPAFVDRIYAVNDASTDGTRQIVSKILPYNKKLALINHEVNRGVGGAIVTGYKKCLEENISIAVVMAGDNQMDPAQMPKLLDTLVEGNADYVLGDRTSKLQHMKGMSLWRRSGNWILRWLTRIASGNFNISDPQNGYTAVTREALSKLNLDNIYPQYGYCNDMLVKLSTIKARISQVSMPAVYGAEKSKIRYLKYIPSVSALLLKNYIWRLRIQIFHRRTKLSES